MRAVAEGEMFYDVRGCCGLNWRDGDTEIDWLWVRLPWWLVNWHWDWYRDMRMRGLVWLVIVWGTDHGKHQILRFVERSSRTTIESRLFLIDSGRAHEIPSLFRPAQQSGHAQGESKGGSSG